MSQHFTLWTANLAEDGLLVRVAQTLEESGGDVNARTLAVADGVQLQLGVRNVRDSLRARVNECQYGDPAYTACRRSARATRPAACGGRPGRAGRDPAIIVTDLSVCC